MKSVRTIALAALALLSGSVLTYADEGMWMVNAISESLVRNMENRGLMLPAGEIYNEEAVSLSDAIVSLDFGCTGSMVSDRGLLITNHHCAYSDVHAISTPEHNYLKDGFWAPDLEDEVHIPGKSAYFLKRVLDVTDEVNATIEAEKAAGKAAGMRRISYLLEKKYAAETGLEASLSSMWAGGKYYLALYEVYTDIRLVAAPPVSIAAFGGDEDNWEWPQHKCDFAMYRIYAGPDGRPAAHSDANVPYKPARKLVFSKAGYMPGDFAMVMGYPGRTSRYSSPSKVSFQQEVSLPITTEARGEQMRIISGWMDRDPEVRLKYSDRYFSLSNVQELQEGELQCLKRFNVVRRLRRDDRGRRDLKEIDALIGGKYEAISDAEKDRIWYRETLIRGSQLGLIASRMKNRHGGLDIGKEYAGLDMRLEKDLFFYAVRAYYGNVGRGMWGPYQSSLYDSKGGDLDAICAALWQDGYMTQDSPMYKFFTDVTMAGFNKAVDDIEGSPTVSELGKEYTRAKADFSWYPDANSTMRLTYGTVGSFRRGWRMLPWQTKSSEILDKEDPSRYDFTLKDDWKALLGSLPEDLPVDFITDNDITGGNSGSPVLNARGEIIGLAFDGNKESLASDVYYTGGYNKCVCVDIRFVLWTLEHYAHMDKVLAEIEVK